MEANTPPPANLASIFKVEHLITPVGEYNIVTASEAEIRKHQPNISAAEIRDLLSYLDTNVVNSDIDGVLACIKAIQIRVTHMQDTALAIKKLKDKNKRKDSE